MVIFSKLFGLPGGARDRGRRAEPGLDAAGSAGFAYPPVDPGLPNVSVDEILADNADLIGRIKLAYGLETAEFTTDLLPLIRRYACYVHLLPATADNYFSAPGGLFRLGIEISHFALQGTDSQIFSGGATILKRRDLEPRWRKATFIAGLCHELYRTLSHVVVTDSAGHEWPPYISRLADWLKAVSAQRYYLKWVPNASDMRSLGVFALPHIVDAPTLQDLANGNSIVVPQMLGCLSGMPSRREHSVLDQLVRRAAAMVIDRDLRASADRYGKPILGSHLERYLLDAMRRLVASNPAWQPNADKSRVWVDCDGVYLIWPSSAADLTKLLEADQLPGIPKAPETILEILIASGVVQPRDESHATYVIYPGTAAKPFDAVRLSFPDILFGNLEPPPVALARALTSPPRDAGVIVAESRPIQAQPSRSAAATDAPATHAQLGLGFPEPAAPVAARTAAMPSAKPSPAAGEDVPSAPAPGSEAASACPAPAEPAPGPAARFALRGGSTLAPPVQSALDSIVGSLNEGTAAKARCLPAGLFIPLCSFEAQKIDTALAVRALFQAGMLVSSRGGASKTTTEEFCGTPQLGVVVAKKYIAGMD